MSLTHWVTTSSCQLVTVWWHHHSIRDADRQRLKPMRKRSLRTRMTLIHSVNSIVLVCRFHLIQMIWTSDSEVPSNFFSYLIAFFESLISTPTLSFYFCCGCLNHLCFECVETSEDAFHWRGLAIPQRSSGSMGAIKMLETNAFHSELNGDS